MPLGTERTQPCGQAGCWRESPGLFSCSLLPRPARTVGGTRCPGSESSFPKATDDTFAAKVYEQCAGHPDFARPRIAQPTFTVHHYAGPVEYTTTGPAALGLPPPYAALGQCFALGLIL